MPTLALDTNAAVKKLEQGGLTRAQADAVTEVIQSIDTSPLATKHDLDLALSKQTTKIVTWVSGILIAHAAGTAALTVSLLQLLS